MRLKLDDLRQITARGEWKALAASVAATDTAVLRREDFETYWIEAGHQIREQVDDDRALIRLLRKMLPPYSGPGLDLYRGENVNRWRAGRLGLAWTLDVETARMFGRGLNAFYGGGVLLRARFEAPAILSAPSEHSRYLDEGQFTVDPFAGTGMVVIEVYPEVT
ncbi:hypothetical protein [Ramlibacter montanisoli]|uniref:Uncharacterized protein n=1 Tax=Ramlibacter montanisoli TaxID=2732512 RepID=A0A849KKB8_9BURK|nr:hypothetical protein [Ramlibacter montanisoli]NNU45235.1 hypothetical protein [Ramlibacter montanisoli]